MATSLLYPPMSFVPAATMLAVAAVAEVTSTTASPDHAIAIALISVVGGFVVMLMQILVKDWVGRHKPVRHPDHDEEQAELNQYLIAEMYQLKTRNDQLQAENDRLKRKR